MADLVVDHPVGDKRRQVVVGRPHVPVALRLQLPVAYRILDMGYLCVRVYGDGLWLSGV